MHGESHGSAGAVADLLMAIFIEVVMAGMADGQPANAGTIGASVSTAASALPIIHFAMVARRCMEFELITTYPA